MEIIEVNTDSLATEFVEMQPGIYKDIPNYIRPLDKDIYEVFDPKKNRTFRNGKLKRWLLKDQGRFIGRIAAFTNSKYKNLGDDGPVGGVGFFECTDNRQAAHYLFETAKVWLKSEGMVAMDGPINFGERDRWWGLVVEGFHEPLYGMNYNPPYYEDLFESYGFQPFFYQICYGMKPKEPLSEKMWARHAKVAEDPAFSSRTIEKNKLRKYAKDFALVYNKAWAGHGGMKQLSHKQVLGMLRTMSPVMDPNILFFIYHKEDPIGIFINLPDLNQWFKYLDGKFGLVQKLRFLWLKRFRKNKKFTGIVFGVVPEWQNKGVDAYLIGEAGKIVQSDKVPYTEYEMQWIGDFNPKMINVAQNLGDVFVSRKLATLRYNFDREKEFKRHPIL